MARTPEGIVKDHVREVLRQEDVYHFLPATHGYGRSGIPDIIACVRGVYVAFECKAGTGKPTALQVRELERIRASGGYAVVVNEKNWDMVRPLIRKLVALPVPYDSNHDSA